MRLEDSTKTIDGVEKVERRYPLNFFKDKSGVAAELMSMYETRDASKIATSLLEVFRYKPFGLDDAVEIIKKYGKKEAASIASTLGYIARNNLEDFDRVIELFS